MPRLKTWCRLSTTLNLVCAWPGSISSSVPWSLAQVRRASEAQPLWSSSWRMAGGPKNRVQPRSMACMRLSDCSLVKTQAAMSPRDLAWWHHIHWSMWASWPSSCWSVCVSQDCAYLGFSKNEMRFCLNRRCVPSSCSCCASSFLVSLRLDVQSLHRRPLGARRCDPGLVKSQPLRMSKVLTLYPFLAMAVAKLALPE